MEEPNLNIKTVAIETLEYDPFNVREHDERNIEAIKASIARFGQQKPIVVKKDGTVIAGNGTLGAMIMLDHKEVTIVETDLEDEEAVAYAIADNRTAEMATWDREKLAGQLETLAKSVMLDAAGFNAQELAGLQGIDLMDEVLGDLDENDTETPEKKNVIVVDFKADDYDKAKALWEYHLKQSDNAHQALLEVLS